MLHHLIVHVTMLLVVAFFILFVAQKADGLVSLFGNILGAWIVIIAVLHIAACFVPGLADKMGMKGPDGAHGPMMMHEHWMHHWGMQPAAPQPAPAAPAKPAPAPKKP